MSNTKRLSMQERMYCITNFHFVKYPTKKIAATATAVGMCRCSSRITPRNRLEKTCLQFSLPTLPSLPPLCFTVPKAGAKAGVKWEQTGCGAVLTPISAIALSCELLAALSVSLVASWKCQGANFHSHRSHYSPTLYLQRQTRE